ncbi:MAG: hypothetical protein Kow0031_14860 [Anaerolineae bacterium]
MRVWVKETKQIVSELWGRQSVEEIAGQVNLWHRRNAQAQGKAQSPSTTAAGVMYQAAKLGCISREEAEAYHKQQKQVQARKKYVSKAVINAVIQRDGGCLVCGAVEDLRIRHIVPVSKGGTSEADNLQTVCAACYQDVKGSTRTVDFRQPYVKEWCGRCKRYHYKNIAV